MVKILENIPLAPLTTFKIGGSARLFVKAETEAEVTEAFKFADENEIEIFVLGGGSNVLIADAGFDGLVLQIALKNIEIDGKTVTAQAGEDWDELVKVCVDNNLQGIECLSGIPGLTGGTPVQNVGAYGQDVSETIAKVRVFDRKSKQILELSNAECKFSYRSSIFNTTGKDRFIVLAVTFELVPDGKPKITYRDLKEFFAGKRPNLKRVRDAVLQIRRAKSMVIDEADINSQGAGSFFKNPLVSKEKFAEIGQSFGAEIPHYAADDNSIKIPAAWLIEQSGFHKGFQTGNVGLSANHTLAVVNFGGAMADEVCRFKEKIQAAVKQKFGIELKPEPVFVGFRQK